MLVAHQSGYREWAAGGRVSLDLSRDRQGLSVSVAPSYGQTASGIDRLWKDSVAHLASASTSESGAQGRVDATYSRSDSVARNSGATKWLFSTVSVDQSKPLATASGRCVRSRPAECAARPARGATPSGTTR